MRNTLTVDSVQATQLQTTLLYLEANNMQNVILEIAHLVSFLDMVTSLLREGDAANHSCSYCNKCYLEPKRKNENLLKCNNC